MRTAILATLAFAAAAVLTLEPVTASSHAEESDLPFLVEHADRIAEVEVLAAQSAMLTDGSIETRYTFSTILPMKGSMPSIQEVRIPGGAVAGRGLLIPGMPDLKIGERTILFLSPEGETKGWRMPVGLAAGAYRVVVGSDGRPSRVIRDTRKLEAGALETGGYDRFVSEIFAEVARQN